MLECAKQKILAIDHSKFGKIGFSKIGSLNDITTVVTDEKPEEEWLRKLNRLGVECIYPE